MPQKRKRKHKYAASISGVFILLAAIGVITVVVASIRLTLQLLDNSREKEVVEDIIRPVVMFNPLPFENPNDIPMTQLLNFSLWSALTSEKGGTYTYDDNQELIVPASDLDVAARQLFGDIKLEHQSFGEMQSMCSYEADKNYYNVPINAELYVYSPMVTEIRKNGEFYDIVVDYIPPGNAWTTDFAGRKSTPTPDKRMIYVMARTKDGYRIIKVQDPPPELALTPLVQEAA